MNQDNPAGFLWSVADLLRGNLKQSQYGRVILPFTVLRRLECVLEPTRAKVLKAAETHAQKPEGVQDRLLWKAANQQFYNTSSLTLGSLSDTQTRVDLMSYVQRFSPEARLARSSTTSSSRTSWTGWRPRASSTPSSSASPARTSARSGWTTSPCRNSGDGILGTVY